MNKTLVKVYREKKSKEKDSKRMRKKKLQYNESNCICQGRKMYVNRMIACNHSPCDKFLLKSVITHFRLIQIELPINFTKWLPQCIQTYSVLSLPTPFRFTSNVSLLCSLSLSPHSIFQCLSLSVSSLISYLSPFQIISPSTFCTCSCSFWNEISLWDNWLKKKRKIMSLAKTYCIWIVKNEEQPSVQLFIIPIA